MSRILRNGNLFLIPESLYFPCTIEHRCEGFEFDMDPVLACRENQWAIIGHVKLLIQDEEEIIILFVCISLA